jgi:hypothetical protein
VGVDLPTEPVAMQAGTPCVRSPGQTRYRSVRVLHGTHDGGRASPLGRSADDAAHIRSMTKTVQGGISAAQHRPRDVP